MSNSDLIEKLKEEGCEIITGNEIVGNAGKYSLQDMEKIIYTEAVPKNNAELLEATKLNIQIQTYPEALAEIVNSKKLIAISGTH